MAKDLSAVKHVVIAMMENRSFDHILGYLGLPGSGHPNASRIEGVQNANIFYAHDTFQPRPLTSPVLDPGPPHERGDIALQINDPALGPMRGFVDSYRRAFPDAAVDRVMEYCRANNLPTTDFLARNFAICDNWFSSLPASTLPNRLMALGGYSLVDHTQGSFLDVVEDLFNNDPDDLVYDWLGARGITWRVYYSGSFFCMQMPRVLRKYEGDVEAQRFFRPIDRLIDDFKGGDVPQVVFVEPLYQDDSRRGTIAATDDHPPASLWGGQRFQKIVYEAMAANKDVWSGLVGIITYDEHGSLFDHVKPPAIPTPPPPNALYAQGFDTLGIRVPAIIVSPFVDPGSVQEDLYDHTSILKFLGEKFGEGRYTLMVDPRPVASLSSALSDQRLADTGGPTSLPPEMI